ncbi:MAG: hypothetical protein IKE58_10410 [Blautia sp.]|nr:hypothetical protein [Blautia sp.]
MSGDDKLNRLIEDLRRIEESVRNRAAHTMIPVTEDLIVRWTGFSSEQIWDKLKTVAEKSRLVKGKDVWNSYDEMNQTIIAVLDKEMKFG